MKERLTREENTIGRFTNWVDTLARRTKYAFAVEEVEISYTFSECDGKFAFEADWLMQAFSELSKTHKRLLELLYVEEKTPQEAAKILGCTVENIYNQRSKAFKVIKKIRKDGQSNENDE